MNKPFKTLFIGMAAASMLALSACGGTDGKATGDDDKKDETVTAVEETNSVLPHLAWESTLPEELQENKVTSQFPPNGFVGFYSSEKLSEVPNSPFAEDLDTWVQVTSLSGMVVEPGDFVETTEQELGEGTVIVEDTQVEDGFTYISGYYDLSEVTQPGLLFPAGVPDNLDEMPDVYFKVYTSDGAEDPDRFIVTAYSDEETDYEASDLRDAIEFKYDETKKPDLIGREGTNDGTKGSDDPNSTDPDQPQSDQPDDTDTEDHDG